MQINDPQRPCSVYKLCQGLQTLPSSMYSRAVCDLCAEPTSRFQCQLSQHLSELGTNKRRGLQILEQVTQCKTTIYSLKLKQGRSDFASSCSVRSVTYKKTLQIRTYKKKGFRSSLQCVYMCVINHYVNFNRHPKSFLLCFSSVICMSL